MGIELDDGSTVGDNSNANIEIYGNTIINRSYGFYFIGSMHDVSDGGLYITLLESSMPRNLGFDITTDAEIRKDRP